MKPEARKMGQSVHSPRLHISAIKETPGTGSTIESSSGSGEEDNLLIVNSQVTGKR